jgi:hypothetical protein
MSPWKSGYRQALGFALGLVALTLTVFGDVAITAGAGPSREGALSLKHKVADISQFATRSTPQPRRTTVTEHEVNSYLAFEAGTQIPAGVVEPAITIVGDGRVAARAVVDLDAVRQQNSQRSLFDPMSYLSGRVAVTASGILRASNGVGRLEVETAAIGRVPVPKLILQEIVSYYSRTAQLPSGLSLDDPFALPARIREIRVETGQAIVVQ